MIETAAAKPCPWDSHGTEISGALQASSELRRCSDLSLERSNWESLHDSPGWLCLHFDLLTEDTLQHVTGNISQKAKIFAVVTIAQLHSRCGSCDVFVLVMVPNAAWFICAHC